jgi:uncharacterized protein YjbI with pentapeptide repeats
MPSRFFYSGADQAIDLSGTSIVSANMAAKCLRRGDFTGASLHTVNLREADLSGAWLMHARCVDGDMSGADLTRVNLSGASIVGTDLTGAVFRRATLRDATLGGLCAMWADFSGADLRRADLSGINAGGASFAGSCLRGAVMQWTDLGSSDLSEADMRQADLSGSDLAGADLTGAILVGAKLSDANLTGADLSGADLSGVVGLAETRYGEDPNNVGRILPPTYTSSTKFEGTDASPAKLGWRLVDESRGVDDRYRQQVNASFEAAINIEQDEARETAARACVLGYAKLAARSPDDPSLLIDCADALSQVDDDVRAIGRVTDAIEILIGRQKPVPGFMYHQRAILLSAIGRNQEAIADLSTAIGNGEGAVAGYHRLRAWLYDKIGEHDKAQLGLRQAVRLERAEKVADPKVVPPSKESVP